MPILSRLHLRVVSICALVCALVLTCNCAKAQTGFASISGRVADSSGAVIQKADVSLKNLDTGVVLQSQSNNDGMYSFPSVQPGNYVMRVQKQGFRSVDVTGLTLYTQDQLARNFAMEVGSASESITVSAAGTTNDSPAVSMTVEREFVENTPLNGGSFQDLIQLAPGAASSQNGYYSMDGQRTDANNFTVDGVSTNLGGINNISGGAGNGGAGIAGLSPVQTALGTTQGLVPIDALQEFTVQTSGYSAEYGRTPGGQIELTTRSGTNQIHGALFDQLRNTVFDANSFINDYFDRAQSPERQNDFGGTFGGPLLVPHLYDGRNRTFYFLSYEGLRLFLPATISQYVPTQALRNYASPSVLPYLNTQPLPNTGAQSDPDGCTITDPTTNTVQPCDALFVYGYSQPESIDSYGIRVDHNITSKLHGFARYSDTPSSITTGAYQVVQRQTATHTWTAGVTWQPSVNLVDDLRFNSAHDSEQVFQTPKAIAGATPFQRSLMIPAAYDNPYAEGEAFIDLPKTSNGWVPEYTGQGTLLRQTQVVDSVTYLHGPHAIKLGGDWRRLESSSKANLYESLMEITTTAAVQQGIANVLIISAQTPGAPIFDNLSIYAQDHWRISPKLSIDYGLRWEFNPPPGPSNGKYPAVLTSSDLAIATLAPLGTAPYRTTYAHFAPRFGFAWTPMPDAKRALVVRGGFGIFFDTAQAAIGQAYFSTYPFLASRPTQTNVSMPLSATALAPPTLPTTLSVPYPNLQGLTTPNLTLPYTEQWNLSLDEAISSNNTVTISYVGNNGRKLLFTQQYSSVPGNPAFGSALAFTSNAGQSNYNALQVQDRGKIGPYATLVGSFTYSHALDNASNDYSSYAPIWGNSAYDLRRALNLALNVASPSFTGWNRWLAMPIRNWSLSNRFTTESGFPLNIIQSYVVLPNGSEETFAPNLVPGVPIYLHGSAAITNTGAPAPGGWMLNRAAFACTTTGATTGACSGTATVQGTLGRNYIRNPSFWAWNTSLQKDSPLFERLRLNFRVDAFNILNHPALGNPTTTLSSSAFGELINGVTTIGTNNSLYAMGAARSLQFSLKLQF